MDADAVSVERLKRRVQVRPVWCQSARTRRRRTV